MLKISGWRLFLLVSVLVLCCVEKSFAEEGSVRRLVSKELLAHSKLERVWDNKLPIKESEKLKRIVILNNRIYVISDRNYMVSLNRHKGSIIFSRGVAPAGFPMLGLEHYKDELFSIIGNALVEINPETGTERRSQRLAVRVTCPAARNNLYFYVAGVDKRVHTLRSEDKVQVFEAAAKNDSKITSIVAADDFAIFSTDAGNVVRISPYEPRVRWEFEASGGIVGPMVEDGESLFVASEDTNVYKINIVRGKLDWKYQSGAVLDEAPRVTEKFVYQYVLNRGLAAIEKGSGKRVWQLAEGVDLLAESGGKAYVITKTGAMAVMDNKTGKKLYSVNLAGVSKYAANVADSKIYIADESGRIACLKPVE
ncbi:MAG: outer membrane protein assembly factor BamB family protein [Planctomycetota bacterium]|jgi:outer membrane protein assembly factor BamB